MQFIQHYSGSKGNLYEVRSRDQRLLIDCGVSWKKILAALDHDLSGVVGCLLTHSHGDHSKVVRILAENGIMIYTEGKTFTELRGLPGRWWTPIRDGEAFRIGSFIVYPFSVQHDVPNLGFLVSEDTMRRAGDRLLFAIDTPVIEPTFGVSLSHVAIECSYDDCELTRAVIAGDRPDFIAKRMRENHMEWQNTLKYLQTCCDLSRCREIHLLHMSSTLPKESVVSEFKKAFGIEVVCV